MKHNKKKSRLRSKIENEVWTLILINLENNPSALQLSHDLAVFKNTGIKGQKLSLDLLGNSVFFDSMMVWDTESYLNKVLRIKRRERL